MIERHHLQLVKAIEQYGTVTKAAKHLFVSQSALSHSMKKLEQSIGAKIWHKRGRTLVLTLEGQRLLKSAQKILPQFENLEQQLQAMVKGVGGNIKIGIECYPCFSWLLQVAAPFLKENPDVDVDLKNEFQFGGIGALLNYEIDLLITPDPLYQSNLILNKVFDYEQVLVVNKTDILASKPFIEPLDLTDKTLFTYPVERSRLDIFNQFLTPASIGVKQHKTLENTEMILQMVKHHRGVAVLPDWLVAQENCQDLVAVKIGKEGIHKSTFIAIRATDEDNSLIKRFIEQSTLIDVNKKYGEIN